jgi:hypothetical protein
MPLSWWHYVIGMRQLTTAAARETLRLGMAARMANAKTDEFQQWVRETRQSAGF